MKRWMLLLIAAFFFVTAGGADAGYDLRELGPSPQTRVYGPLIPIVAAAPAEAETKALFDGGFVDRDLIVGALKIVDRKMERRDRRRQVVREFLSIDGGAELLASQIKNDGQLQAQLTPVPDTGHPFVDRLTWFIENLDELLAAMQKLIDFFNQISIPGPESAVLDVPGHRVAVAQLHRCNAIVPTNSPTKL